jgi:hypothetical protein
MPERSPVLCRYFHGDDYELIGEVIGVIENLCRVIPPASVDERVPITISDRGFAAT